MDTKYKSFLVTSPPFTVLERSVFTIILLVNYEASLKLIKAKSLMSENTFKESQLLNYFESTDLNKKNNKSIFTDCSQSLSFCAVPWCPNIVE